MAIEIVSRLLTLAVVAAFAWLLARGRLPVVPPGRWTVAILFVAGLGMCTLAGIRDGIGPDSVQPDWLTTTFGALGIGAAAVLLAVILGLGWRMGTALLAGLIAFNWVLAFGYGWATGSASVGWGVVTLLAGAVIWLFVTRWSALPRAASPMPA
jgi:hypothetical protein